jgi:hypothetical protein
MYKISNGMLDQAEIVLKDRWAYGPLELVFVNFPVGRYGALDSDERAREQLAFIDWNRHHHGGFVRDGEACEVFDRLAPGVFRRGSPNVILVPEYGGANELHFMLASLLPDQAQIEFGVKRGGAIYTMTAAQRALPSTVEATFERTLLALARRGPSPGSVSAASRSSQVTSCLLPLPSRWAT